MICSDTNKTSVLDEKYRGNSMDCLRQALNDNFINKKPQKYSQEWEGLIELLKDVGLQTLAKKVKEAISCM